MQWIGGAAFTIRTAPGRFLLILIFLSAAASIATAQSASFTEKLTINGSVASCWSDAAGNVVQVTGPVTITLDQNIKCSADQAVIWLSPVPHSLLAEQEADIVLIGNAKLVATDNHLTRKSPTLIVNTIIRGAIELTSTSKLSQNLSQSKLYQEALAQREAGDVQVPQLSVSNPGPAAIPTTSTPPTLAVGGTNASGVVQPPTGKGGYISFHAPLTQESIDQDGNQILILSGGVWITDDSANGDFVSLQAKDVVLFTGRPPGKSSTTAPSDFGHDFKSAYLEGDVQMNYIPAAAKIPQQVLTADSVYYDFQTGRSILTSVVFHAVDPTTQTPVTVRARVMQRISHAEFGASNVQFTTSRFAVPTYSIGASYAYIHQEPEDHQYYNVESKDDVLHILGIPVFFWPALGGTLDTKAFPLREFSTGNSSRYGFTMVSDWGLFETLGKTPPKGLDVDYRIDYFSERGPGGGFNGNYKGGFITDAADPWNFQGDFKSYIMSDRGIDDLGGLRTDVKPPTELRGRFLWEHQHFLPDDWQVQVRVGYVSDPNFLEEYYQPEFDSGLPSDAEFYVKRQHDTEALSFLVNTDTTNFTTNADRQQEQFDVAHLPEIKYQRIGDSIINDKLTFFSNSSADVLKFDRSDFSLQEQGFFPPGLSPGQPSDGFTGTTDSIVYRGDTREEIDWPVALGPMKLVPYVTGRVTAYSKSPVDDGQTRLYGVAGARLATSFWRVDDSIDSNLFNLHRVRHIIQPEVNVFTTGTTVDESKLFIYDQDVDAINDITGASVALHQHWETMRGGPGRWQSVDFLDINIEGDFYPHTVSPTLLAQNSFRSLFFPSVPETSIPRQSANADVTWHIGDDTAFIADYQWDIDKRETSIAEAGFAINRGSRLSYYIGDAYIAALNSQVLSFNMNYNLTAKYNINLNQAFDFGQSRAAVIYLTVARRFDVLAVSFSVFHDEINKTNGFYFNLYPAGQPGFSAPWRVND